MNTPSSAMLGPRKYFLDWLRVIAFALLIVFHVGMLYVTWPYNLKSPRIVAEIEPFMNALVPWRMALIFFISGVASRFLLRKLGPGGFALDRLRRLVPPILFGMFVVIPPQTYVELFAKGVTHQDYLSFWLHSYLPADQTMVAPLGKTMPTWDHLWFLVYLLDYALIFALLAALFRRKPTGATPLPLLLIVPPILLVAANIVIQTIAPLTHALVNDWGGHFKWIAMFTAGALCAAQDAYWEAMAKYRAILAGTALALLATLSFANDMAWTIVSSLYAWAMVCTLCGYAAAYLNRPSGLLSHLNEAILPIYVLHQPIMLIAAYFVFPLQLPLAIEAPTLMAITAAGAFMIYETFIRPLALMRFLFGLKPREEKRAAPPRELASSANS